MGSTSFEFSISDKLGSLLSGRDAMCLCHCGSPEPSLIGLLPGQEVPCGIGNIPETRPIVVIWSPTVVTTGAAVGFSFSGVMTARIINSAVLYFSSHSQK